MVAELSGAAKSHLASLLSSVSSACFIECILLELNSGNSSTVKNILSAETPHFHFSFWQCNEAWSPSLVFAEWAVPADFGRCPAISHKILLPDLGGESLFVPWGQAYFLKRSCHYHFWVHILVSLCHVAFNWCLNRLIPTQNYIDEQWGIYFLFNSIRIPNFQTKSCDLWS